MSIDIAGRRNLCFAVGAFENRDYSRDVELRTPLGPEGARVFLKILAVPWFSGKKPLQRSLRISGAGVLFFCLGSTLEGTGPERGLVPWAAKGSGVW